MTQYLVVAGALLVLVIFLIEQGRWIGIRTRVRNPETLRPGSGALEAAVFGLMGLLVAFTFSGALSRYEVRRNLITEEANAILTACRLELLPVRLQNATVDLALDQDLHEIGIKQAGICFCPDNV